MLTAIVLLLLRPVVAECFWWQVSRGRAVAEGSISPSADLLVAEASREADWLGGLPWYLGLVFLGPTVVSAVPLGIAVLILLAVNREYDAASRGLGLLILFCGVVAANRAWAPTPGLYDVLGIAALWWSSNRWTDSRSVGSLICVCLIQVLWANSGPLSVLGLPVVALGVAHGTIRRNGSTESVPQSLSGVIPLMVGLLLASISTPAGVRTLVDSGAQLFPLLFVDGYALIGTTLQAPTLSFSEPESVAFVILSLMAAGVIWVSRPGWLDIAVYLLVQAVGWSSQAGLPPAAFWLTLWSLRQWREAHHAERVPTALLRMDQVAAPAAAMICLALSVFLGAGLSPGAQTRWGLGISPQLETGLFEDTLAKLPLDGSAHCTGVLETGMVAWSRPGELRPYDVPQRAFLGGRLAAHARINHDLANNWRDRHYRADGSPGGWWLPLTDRDTRLIVVPARNTKLVRALDATNFRPVVLDTPCIACAYAGDPDLTPSIVHVLSQLELIENGPWTFPEPPAAGTGRHIDLLGMMLGKHDVRADVRIAATLRAMQHRTGALRLLRHALRARDHSGRAEFARIQNELGLIEEDRTGSVSQLRRTAAQIAAPDETRYSVGDQVVDTPAFKTAVQTYVEGRLPEAIGQFAEDNPEAVYARGLLALENGQLDQAAEQFVRLIRQFPEASVTISGRNVLAAFNH